MQPMHHCALFLEARIGLPSTITLIGLVCICGNCLMATQLLRSILTEKVRSCGRSSAGTSSEAVTWPLTTSSTRRLSPPGTDLKSVLRGLCRSTVSPTKRLPPRSHRAVRNSCGRVGREGDLGLHCHRARFCQRYLAASRLARHRELQG